MADLIERAIEFIRADRDNLFECHSVKGVLTIDDEGDQLATDSIARMDAWLAEAEAMPLALRDVTTERRRHVEVEGWTAEHDDKHTRGELAYAAACYALLAANRSDETPYSDLPGRLRWRRVGWVRRRFWPWGWEWWKPSNARRDLVKAAALIIAEIERLDRAEVSRG